MTKLVVDLETNGLLHPWDSEDHRVLSRVWCGCAIDVDTEEEYKFTDIDALINHIKSADELIGHDLQSFDMRVLQRLYGFTFKGKLFDTKLAARCIYPDTKMDDFRSKVTGKPWQEVPSKLMGSHTLEAWGIRLGLRKGDFRSHKDSDADVAKKFEQYTPEMLEYCLQDVKVTVLLFKHLISKKPSEEMLKIEHEFAKVIDQQKANGFRLDLSACQELVRVLQIKRSELDEKLKNLFPPREVNFFTKVKKLPRTKTIIFNPGSRDQICWNLSHKYGWQPKKFSEKSGKPVMDEKILEDLDYPETKQLIEYLLLDKRIGQIAEGKQAWLKLVHTDNKIHGGVNTNGTVTGRVSHVAPNMGQIPRVGNPYGEECRSVFLADPSWDLIGCDAAGLQIRLLAHYLAKYDNGEYTRIVCTGDPHTNNQQKGGFASRDEAKTVFYATLFGAGSRKIARMCKRSEGEGRQLLNSLLRAIPHLKRLRADIGQIIKIHSCLVGLDGRRYPIRSEHVGLNTLLMGAEAVVMKKANIIFNEQANKNGWFDGKEFKQVAFVHDEIQITAPIVISRRLGLLLADSIRLSGEYFNLKCPLKGEFKVGKNWAQTH